MSEANPEPFRTPPISPSAAALSPGIRAGIALIAPAVVAIFVSTLVNNLVSSADVSNGRSAAAVWLGAPVSPVGLSGCSGTTCQGWGCG
ncbi:MAG: hypothetical protein M5U34_15435 [Chloroflexi bacterium]|nr:hypothetical protein [Chloroflexota bacterium]